MHLTTFSELYCFYTPQLALQLYPPLAVGTYYESDLKQITVYSLIFWCSHSPICVLMNTFAFDHK